MANIPAYKNQFAKPSAGGNLRRGHPLANGLIAAWTCHEYVGPTATGAPQVIYDRFSNKQSTPLAGTSNWGFGPSGTALYLDAGNGNGSLDTNFKGNIEGINRITVATRVAYAGLATGSWTVLKNGGTDFGLTLGNSGGNNIATFTFNGTQPQGTNTIPQNTWGTLVGMYDGTNVTVWWENILQASSAASGLSVPASGTTVHFGTTNINADIDYVYIWNRALTPSDMGLLQFDPYVMWRMSPFEVFKTTAAIINSVSNPADVFTSQFQYGIPT